MVSVYSTNQSEIYLGISSAFSVHQLIPLRDVASSPIAFYFFILFNLFFLPVTLSTISGYIGIHSIIRFFWRYTYSDGAGQVTQIKRHKSRCYTAKDSSEPGQE